MNKFLNMMENKLGPIADKLSSNRYLQAVQAGFLLSMPLVIVGSIFLIICFIPINGYGDFMAGILGANWMSYFIKIHTVTMSVMSLFVIMGIANSLAKYYKVEQLSCVAAALASFLIVVPITNDTIAVDSFGAGNLFTAMLISILSVEIMRFIIQRKWVIKMPASVPANIAASFSALIPALITLVVFNLVSIGFSFTPYGTFDVFVSTIVQYPLQNLAGTLPAMMLISFFETLFWCFGIHGSNVTGAVATPMLTALTAENAAATLASVAPTNIINAQFWNNFLHLGGAGATLGLVVLMLFFARSKQFKSLGRLVVGPSIFQVNEPVIFGFPLVLNPIMMIPFMLGQLVSSVICYFSFATGLVPIINGANLTWTVPPFVSGWLLCGWRGAALQLVCLAVNVFVWLPFFRICDRRALAQEKGEDKPAVEAAAK